MSSGFPGGHPDFFNVNGGGVNDFGVGSVRMINMNYNGNTNAYRSPLPGILAGGSEIGTRRSDLIGKRSLAEFQQQQLQQAAMVYLRNMKPKLCNQYTSPIGFSNSPENFSGSNVSSPSSSTTTVHRYGVPVFQKHEKNFNLGTIITQNQSNQNQFSRFCSPNLGANAKQPLAYQQTENSMRNQLQELEKQLLLDEEDGENDVGSAVTDSEWSETIQNLLSTTPAKKPENTLSNSPTTSSSSSSASSSISPATIICPKQLVSDTVTAIVDGKSDSAVEILSRLNQISNACGTPEQRLTFYMASALRARLHHPTASSQSTPAPELYCKEHVLSTQLLYDKSPCFKLAFMAANRTILEAVFGSGQSEKKIHIVDFDIGQGTQYVYLLHEIAAAREADPQHPVSLKLTTFAGFGNGSVERLMIVGDGLKMLSNKLSVGFNFNVLNFKLSNLRTDELMVDDSEVLSVNFAFKLYRLPDESVTTDNLRDEVLRRVKSLSPALVTVAEQELNANTASFTTRVNDAWGYYGALFESLDSTLPSDNSERVRIEEGMSRKLVNAVACEERDRVERCEVYGKWQARMRMAGFEPKRLSQLSVEYLISKLNSMTRVNQGFTVKEYSDGISFGWMGRNLTVASAWH